MLFLLSFINYHLSTKMVVVENENVATIDDGKIHKEKMKMVQDLADDDRLRLDSQCSTDSGFEGLENLEPLNLDDVRRYSSVDIKVDHDSGHDETDEELEMPRVSLFSVAMAMMKKNKSGKEPKVPKKYRSRAAQNWMKALRIISGRGKCDPWEKFFLDDLPVEKVLRHRYNALAKDWKEDYVYVRIDKKPFDQGAMRECFRMKKMDTYCPEADWIKDSNNYVAKRYKTEEDGSRGTYFDDVRLQMDAKLWGEEFNRHNPPKKVDIFMMSVYEFVDRPGSPLFHVEHFIDGDYMKYNSNSGFVDTRVCRQTPHAFSHFTFECSGHELIVVDIQGVGDLYTDPQIHTVDGRFYGDGNLGVKGMALFFHSHTCNAICKTLGLSPFSLSVTEKQQLHSASSSTTTSISQTVLRGHEVALSDTPSEEEMSTHLQAFFRHRSFSGRYSSFTEESCDSPRMSMGSESDKSERGDEEESDTFPSPGYNRGRRSSITSACSRLNVRRGTELFDDGGMALHLMRFREHIRQKKRPACFKQEMKRTMTSYDDSVLGMVHLELAKYHELCRFTDDGTYDKNAALFHLQAAADCGVVVALVNMARIYCDLPHDILSDVNREDCPADDEADAIQIGVDYMERAASAGERAAMVYIAQAYDTGLNLPNPETDRSTAKALYWYEEIQEYDQLVEEDGSEPEWGIADPPYLILARQAEIYLLDDVEGVDKNPERSGELYNLAAESAMSCMKGKLANKYYMLAEEAYGQMEE